MLGTPVDTLPGGLIDLLAKVAPAGPATDVLRRGRFREALAVLDADPAGDGLSPGVRSAWRYVIEHATLLWLPEGGALPYLDAVDPRPGWPHQPPDPPPEDPDRPAAWALVQLCAGLRDMRGMLPPLTDSRTSPAVLLLTQCRSVLDRTRTEVVPQMPHLAPHLDLLEAELAARSGVAEDLAWSAMAAAQQGFRAQDDERGLAASLIVAGDWSACPFASPVSWGLCLGNPTSQDSSLPDVSEQPEQSAPIDAGRAAAAYAEAEALYRAAGDERGASHVAWRVAYLRYATGDTVAAAEQAAVASQALEAAGEEGAALVAGAHAVLAGLEAGELPDVDAAAQPVVDWAKGPGSLALAIGTGRLYARTGRRLAMVARRAELSLTASEIAEAVWAGLGRTVSRSQVRADQAETLRALGARRAAVVMIESALDIATPPLTGEVVMDVRWSRPLLLLADLYNLANAAMDVVAIDRARRRLDGFTSALHDPRNRATPEQSAIADQFLGFVSGLDHDVVSLLYRGQDARDAGDPAAAAVLFTQAEAAVPTDGPAAGATPFLALVRAFELRMDEAATIYREWLNARLTEIELLRPQATGSGSAALLRQQERATRSQAVFFGVRVGDVTTARTQLDVLRTMADPWWEGLGSSWEHDDVEGRLLESEGNLVGASEAFGRAVDAVERVRRDLRRDDLRVAFGADRIVQQVYRNAARVFLRRRDELPADDPARGQLGWTAVRMLEQGRSRALMDLLTAPDPGLPRDILDDWRGAQAVVSLAQDRLAAALDADPADPVVVTQRREALRRAQEALEVQVERLRGSDPRFWQLAGPGVADAGDPARIATSLDEGDLVLLFSVDRPDLVCIAIDASGLVSAVWSREERRIDALERRLVAACRDAGAWQAAADELGSVVLEPHAEALARSRRLHVVASGPLLAVPFGALCLHGRPLADHLVVTTLPALSAYPILRARDTEGPALCVGNPTRMSYQPSPESPPVLADPLPGAGIEAAAVARIYGVAPLLGANATERALREGLPGAGVVHLATHGIVDAVSPLASSVLLAEGDALTVAEFLALRMDADLVVLSACQTGSGSPVGGDELLGLGRALVAAGARAAVVTLWPVDDIAAAVFMAHFHAIRASGHPPGEALHATQQWMRRLTRADLQAEFAALAAASSDRPRGGLSEPSAGGDAGFPDTGTSRLVATAPPLAPRQMPTPDHPAVWAPFVLIGR